MTWLSSRFIASNLVSPKCDSSRQFGTWPTGAAQNFEVVFWYFYDFPFGIFDALVGCHVEDTVSHSYLHDSPFQCEDGGIPLGKPVTEQLGALWSSVRSGRNLIQFWYTDIGIYISLGRLWSDEKHEIEDSPMHIHHYLYQWPPLHQLWNRRGYWNTTRSYIEVCMKVFWDIQFRLSVCPALQPFNISSLDMWQPVHIF